MKPKIKTTCTKLQLQLLSFCLLCLSGKTRCDGNGPAVVTVEQGRDAVLPCSLSSKENIELYLFDWKKPAQIDGGQKEVFMYDVGIHYNNGRAGQSEEFKGRVSHFPEELKHGNAAIIIRNTKLADSGDYTCVFPRLQPPQTFHIKLVVEPVVIPVKQDGNALLPCSLSTKENIEQEYFYWYKVAQNNEKQKEVFLYEKGRHSPSFGSQDDGFKGRVSHFPQELKHGNASIIIRNTKMADSGDYTCVFPERQPFHIKLVVGAATKPVIGIFDHTDNSALLQCEVNGNPQPEVEWRDSAGNKLPAQTSHVSERDGRFFITLNTTVTKTDLYRCVATQKNISHQIYAETSVRLNGPAVVTVEQDSDAVLPCSLSSKENIEFHLFDWKKPAQIDGRQKKVFYYDAGIHYNNGRAGQSEEFKGRVSHFPEELKHGNASIIIRNTKMTDSGDYTCVFANLQPPQTFHIELVVEPVVVIVEQDGNALLPCSLSTKENIEQEYFYWYKVPQNNEKQKEVFLYEKGKHSPSFGSQDNGFKDRVSHFQEELKHGNASIIIRNTKIADSGVYTCTFPERQPFHIKLVVERALKDRSDENIPGAAPKPNIRTLIETDNSRLLQCEANGHPQPEVEWRDSAGNKLPAQKPQVTEKDGRFYVTLNTTVTKTGNYRCVATQKDISHQIHDETSVRMNGPTVISVYKGDAAPLPCSLSTKKNIESEMFEWKKDGQKEVFLYDKGTINGRSGQSEEFKGRVFHFPNNLKHGDASITIRNTELTDSGNYTCDFPHHQPSQTFHIELVVETGNSGSGAHSSGSTGRTVAGVVGSLLFFVIVVLAVLVYKGYIPLKCNKGSPADPKEGSAVPLNGRPSQSQEAPDPET